MKKATQFLHCGMSKKQRTVLIQYFKRDLVSFDLALKSNMEKQSRKVALIRRSRQPVCKQRMKQKMNLMVNGRRCLREGIMILVSIQNCVWRYLPKKVYMKMKLSTILQVVTKMNPIFIIHSFLNQLQLCHILLVVQAEFLWYVKHSCPFYVFFTSDVDYFNRCRNRYNIAYFQIGKTINRHDPVLVHMNANLYSMVSNKRPCGLLIKEIVPARWSCL